MVSFKVQGWEVVEFIVVIDVVKKLFEEILEEVYGEIFV